MNEDDKQIRLALASFSVVRTVCGFEKKPLCANAMTSYMIKLVTCNCTYGYY